jgi:hypothetical protein
MAAKEQSPAARVCSIAAERDFIKGASQAQDIHKLAGAFG